MLNNSSLDFISSGAIIKALIAICTILFTSTLLLSLTIINQRKTISDLTKVNNSKSIFIKKVGYELKTQVNGILGFSEMLIGSFFGQLNITQCDRIRDISICGKRIRHIIDDFLNLIHIKAGRIEILISKFHLEELIDDVLDNLNEKITSNDVNIVKHFNNPKIIIKSDQQKVFLAINNVVDNAIKFSSKGGQITITNEISNDNVLTIKVADNGHGIAKDELPYVFNYPGEEGKDNSVSGMGIGLPLAKLMVELNGGKIIIDSEVGVGTTATIILPNQLIANK